VQIDALIKKMRTKEKRRCINVKLSYLVASEMFAHLADPPSSQGYVECKYGLYAASQHINMEFSRVLPASDSELYQFIFDSLPQAETIRQQSLINLIFHFVHHSFDDFEIQARVPQFQTTAVYLQTLKDSWLDSFANYFIRKHEPTFVGGWQLFASDPARRTQLLNEINAAEASGNIFKEFALGVCLYIINGFQITHLTIDEPLIQKVVDRFKPIFQLQLYIMKNICQGGYNLQKRQNDVTDFLIMTSFAPDKTIFVSNETNQLVPRLHSFGYSQNVLTLNEYLKALGIKQKVGI
jgi:hypothetical protein